MTYFHKSSQLVSSMPNSLFCVQNWILAKFFRAHWTNHSIPFQFCFINPHVGETVSPPRGCFLFVIGWINKYTTAIQRSILVHCSISKFPTWPRNVAREASNDKTLNYASAVCVNLLLIIFNIFRDNRSFRSALFGLFNLNVVSFGQQRIKNTETEILCNITLVKIIITSMLLSERREQSCPKIERMCQCLSSMT